MWDEGKQVEESIRQRAGTPQPQQKGHHKGELNEFNPQGLAKEQTIEADSSLRKQPQE